MQIYLIGMPGSGKTTIGEKLAKELHMEFIDLDAYIAEKNAMFVEDIIHRYGEQVFREKESEALADLIDKQAVISTGGGVNKKKKNKTLMPGIKMPWLQVL